MTRFIEKRAVNAGNPLDDSKEKIALPQNVVQDQPIKLNGIFADKVNNTVPILKHDCTRNITIHSLVTAPPVNLNGFTFVIKGFQNGVLITENLEGPESGQKVESVNSFDEILSITPTENGAANGVCFIGLGNKGFCYFPIDPHLFTYNLSVFNSKTNKILALKVYSSLSDLSKEPFSFSEIESSYNANTNITDLFRIDNEEAAINFYTLSQTPYAQSLLLSFNLEFEALDANHHTTTFRFLQG